MGLEFEVTGLEEGIDNLKRDIDAFDVERVKRETSRRLAEEMLDMVHVAINAEDDISVPASLNSIYTSGPGPTIIKDNAWEIEKTGTGTYSLRPVKKVQQRAYVLNYGYPGRIEPNQAEALKFEIGGEPVFADSVEGPDRTGYWEAAQRMLGSSGKVREIMEDELEKEADRI